MIQKTTLQFLKKLKKNNNKPWFDSHKELYLEAKKDFEEFVQRVLDSYAGKDPAIAALQAKDCVFRIYKDVRFSKDKTPYKTHFSAAFNKAGKKAHSPGYYFHISPGGNSYFGAGIWMPDAPELKKIRQEIDYNFSELKSILHNKSFKTMFGEMEDESALTRPPQGYCEDNPAIGYLKMKSFFAGREFSDEVVCSPKLLKESIKTYTALKPMVEFLARALD